MSYNHEWHQTCIKWKSMPNTPANFPTGHSIMMRFSLYVSENCSLSWVKQSKFKLFLKRKKSILTFAESMFTSYKDRVKCTYTDIITGGKKHHHQNKKYRRSWEKEWKIFLNFQQHNIVSSSLRKDFSPSLTKSCFHVDLDMFLTNSC